VCRTDFFVQFCDVAQVAIIHKTIKSDLAIIKYESKQGVCQSHCGLAIYIKKYFKAKEELWKLNYFTMTKI
jgi:hypothetical protein